MTSEFTMQLNKQQEWSWLLAIDLFLGGLGGGLFLFYEVFELPVSIGLLSLGLVVVGGLVLLMELGHPWRAWRAICRPFSSWISRGVIFVLLFVISSSLYIAPAFDLFSWLPWAPLSLGGKVLGVIAGVSACLVALYPGFVLSASPSIPSWNSPLLPVLFFSHSVTGASGILLLLSPLGLLNQRLEGISSLAVLLIGANFVLIAFYLMVLKKSGLAAKESVRHLNEGSLSWTFKVGVILVGTVFPLLVVVWMPSAVVLAGAFVLIGGLLFRYCVLKSGVYVPFALT